MEPTVPRRNGALVNRISAPNFYSLCTPRVATKPWDIFLIFCAVAGRGRLLKRGTLSYFRNRMGCKAQIFRVRGDSLEAASCWRNSTSGDHFRFHGRSNCLRGKTGGYFLDPQRDLWNVTNIIGCGKEFARPYAIYRLDVGRRFRPPEGRMKGHFSKVFFSSRSAFYVKSASTATQRLRTRSVWCEFRWIFHPCFLFGHKRSQLWTYQTS